MHERKQHIYRECDAPHLSPTRPFELTWLTIHIQKTDFHANAEGCPDCSRGLHFNPDVRPNQLLSIDVHCRQRYTHTMLVFVAVLYLFAVSQCPNAESFNSKKELQLVFQR